MPWFYGPGGEKAIFAGPEDAIPAGWTAEPKFHPIDHERDSQLRGSLKGPRVKARARLQRKAQ